MAPEISLTVPPSPVPLNATVEVAWAIQNQGQAPLPWSVRIDSPLPILPFMQEDTLPPFGGVQSSQRMVASKLGWYFATITAGGVVVRDSFKVDLRTRVLSKTAANGAIQGEYVLAQNHPNPFNPTTQIRFSLLQAGQVHLAIYNLVGREIKVLINARVEAGQHSVMFDATSLPSGMYFYQIKAGAFVETKRMVLMK